MKKIHHLTIPFVRNTTSAYNSINAIYLSRLRSCRDTVHVGSAPTISSFWSQLVGRSGVNTATVVYLRWTQHNILTTVNQPRCNINWIANSIRVCWQKTSILYLFESHQAQSNRGRAGIGSSRCRFGTNPRGTCNCPRRFLEIVWLRQLAIVSQTITTRQTSTKRFASNVQTPFFVMPISSPPRGNLYTTE